MDQLGGNRWKRGNDWREGPAFLDATSSISVSTFGARRLPELKNLYFQARFQDGNPSYRDDSIVHERKNLMSGGGKRSSRHLRRRTTSIQSKRHRHRYPYPMTDVLRDESSKDKSPEDTKNNPLAGAQPDYKGATRKSKRKKRSLLEGERLKWLLSTEGSDDCSPNKSWLVTHLWHSKRFHVLLPSPSDPTFGYWTGIPLVHTNRGPRAALRLSQNKDESASKETTTSAVMIRDITWEWQPLFLVCSSKEKTSSKQQSTQEVQVLLQQLGTICPGLVQQDKQCLSKFLSGSISVEETIFEPNAFPSGAIGPGVWRFLPTSDQTTVEIRCHPSIRPGIQKVLQQLAKSIPDSSPLDLKTDSIAKDVPRISFRLYGVESWKVLNKVLKLQQGNFSSVIEKHQEEPSPSGVLPHGTIIEIENVEIIQKTPSSHESDQTTLIYRAPRPLDCAANCAMAGWEVHCSNAVFAKSLWLEFVTFDNSNTLLSSNEKSNEKKNSTIRGCCAIGLIEDCHMRLECEPPIPIFPRDYVDTQDSQKYWMGRSSCSWKRIRQLCEGGWGRLPVDKERRLDKLESMNFSKLVDLDDADDSGIESDNENKRMLENEGIIGNIVTVRGAFGQPFVDAIQGSCGNYKSSNARDQKTVEPKTKKRRRNRRSIRPKNQVILAPPLSKASRASLGDYCHRLSSSLSLPAVLLVHVCAIGQGRIAPGMSIVCVNSDSEGILGRITAGSFSPSRGICHGIGVVGAVRLLEYIGRTTQTEDSKKDSATSYGRIVRLANGLQSLQLLVKVVKSLEPGVPDEGGCEASLSALI
eukprot:CAMPEP_0116118916 /NCGR_PEP_ID=MMETSP0329-20121206/2363_1 /TAXON_ID=697910 /ORGANISM="Pseudo-nitzschia arenysensis, Strain B593" /LENGTH=807 /DNA_ID=CAMNT_0003612583 /DNA_START=42 /DNA_END=2465 /DNA_ORIENTATION=+